MKKLITEFIGTFFLVLVVGTAAVGSQAAPGFAPIAIGAILMVMIFAGGHISGAHYNPAVTLAVLIRGRIKAGEAISYMIVQIIAGVVAALVTYFLVGDKLPATTDIDLPVQGLVAELLGTFALAYVVLNVATAKANAGNSFYGLAIGLTVTACAYALGGFTGGAFNPAVAAGLLVMKFKAICTVWIYLVGCFGGGLLAGLVFKMNNCDDK